MIHSRLSHGGRSRSSPSLSFSLSYPLIFVHTHDSNNGLDKVYSDEMDADKNSDEDADKVDFDEVDPNEMGSGEDSDKDADKVDADKVDFNKVDPDKMDSDKDPDELDSGKANDKANPDKVDLNKVDSDKFDPKKIDLDAVVTLGASTFKSNISSNAISLRSSRSRNSSKPLTHGPNLALHERTISVLDALAYVSVNKSSPAVTIGLAMKPL